MNSRRWLGLGLAGWGCAAGLMAQVPDLVLPRPGAIVVAELTGEVSVAAGGQRRVPKVDERVRVGSTLSTGRRALLTVALSNGASVQLGAESEVEVEEFGQAPVPTSVKVAELREEPTLSRTRLNLLRGDVTLEVKPLKVSRGSSFHLTMAAGVVRVAEGTVRARVQMSDLGLGVATLEVAKGKADIELPSGTVAALPAGEKVVYALEIDRVTGVTKVGPMPAPPGKK